MRYGTMTLILCLLISTGFSQNSRYEFPGRLTPTIKKDKLNELQCLSEILPVVWRNTVIPRQDRYILDQLLSQQSMFVVSVLLDHQNKINYTRENFNKVIDLVSVQISGICNGKTRTAQNTSDVLTAEQKIILNIADLGTDISIKFKFNFKGQPGGNTGPGNKSIAAETTFTVVPETEAEYPGGYKQIGEYFTETVINKMSESSTVDKIQQVILKFTINEEGQIVDAKISRTSSDPQIDKLLLEATNKMPRWKPAENSQGVKVKQEFSIPFSMGC